MGRRAWIGLLLGLLLLLLAGCGEGPEASGDQLAAKEFVKSQGYTITSSGGPIYSYQLDRSLLYGSPESTPFRQMWAVQQEEPDKYFGHQITIYRFTVKQHPLERIYKKKTNVFIMMSKGKVIGGYSYPDMDAAGAVYSLDGRTLEELTGLSYTDWLEQWQKKYSP
ncbi:hypothetical protein GCM10023310_60760 [Paenibacillus vulneris]|uniref:Lipoprotein n=1 Tax=Paenibacillus vulneris TaxID=1133364 RepID=A0ABW3UM90_9BACL